MSIRTTKVDVYLVNPDGSPVTAACFYVRPIRAGFMTEYAGISLDTEFTFKTDYTGHALIDLVALPYPYELVYDDSDDSVPGTFLFYVPDVDFTVNFQDLIVTRADSQDKYVDNALSQIIEALAKSKNYAEEAEAAAQTAEQSEQAAEAAEAQTKQIAQDTSGILENVQTINSSMQETYTAFTTDYAAVIAAALVIQNSVLTGIFQLGSYYLWVDSSGLLRVDTTKPENSSATTGTVVGDQTAS